MKFKPFLLFLGFSVIHQGMPVSAAADSSAGAATAPEKGLPSAEEKIFAPENHYSDYPGTPNPPEGMAWPAGQALPRFARPASGLDRLTVQDLSRDEQITFSALQGQVNRRKPRIFLRDARTDEGMDTWLDTPLLELAAGQDYTRDNKFDLLVKYADEVTGVVLYDPDKSPHYRNLAGTVAACRRALPVTVEVYAKIRESGAALKVVEDLTGLALTTPLEIYGHLLEHYWPACGKRLIVSAKPFDERGRGDYHHTRDLAAATGSAVVWLNTLDPAEKALLQKFFAGMKAGEGTVLGWYTSERSGISAASAYGLSTLPADFFISSTVFAGTNPLIRIPAVPRLPVLQKKLYATLFISDGDNIQYAQRALRRNWDRTASSRGRIPLNWTMAPGLVDIAPGILNYYYSTSTPLDCFVTGPSGMGYLMPFNTLEEPGAPVGDNLPDAARMNAFARLTETYLQRSGLRVMTIWDDATPMQRQAFEKHCRNLYGATVQNFRDVPAVTGSVENNRLHFDKLIIPYTGSLEHLERSMSRQLRRWDGTAPAFMAWQVDAWGQLSPARLIGLSERLNQEFPGMLALVRADHYFNLKNMASGLPFNLSLSSRTTAGTAPQSPDDVKPQAPAGPAAVLDGTPSTLWTAPSELYRTIQLNFGQPMRLSRYVIRHAGECGLARTLNTRDFIVSISNDGESWKQLHHFAGNHSNVTDAPLPEATTAEYFRITISNPGADGIARLAEVEVFGTSEASKLPQEG